MTPHAPNDSPRTRGRGPDGYPAGADGVPTGFPSLDHLLGGGLRRGDLAVLGGDTGSGASALALGIALRTCAAGHAVSLVSGEMSAARLRERAMAIDESVAIDTLRHHLPHKGGATPPRLPQPAPRLVSLLDLDPDAPAHGVGLLLMEGEGDLLVVDPLEALPRGRLSLDDELVAAVRDLKALAVSRHAAVLLLAHCAAPAAGRPDPRPQLADFPGGGAVRHHADLVLGLFREEQYDSLRDLAGAAEVHVLKNRNGPLGYADLFFRAECLRFEDVAEP